jgi:hypothetical protein
MRRARPMGRWLIRGLLACAVATSGCAHFRSETRDEGDGNPPAGSAAGRVDNPAKFDRNLGLESNGLD